MKNLQIFLLALLATFGVYATGSNPMSIEIPADMMDAARKSSQEAVQNLSSEEQAVARQFATTISEYSNSSEFKKRQNEMKAQVMGTAGIDKNSETEQGPQLAGNQLVMFVSSSMPIETLRNYARDLSKVGGVMAMRGTVGGISKMVDTITLTRKVLNANPTCEGANCKMWGTEMLIDPMLFRIYGINKVPALIYQPDMNIQSYCDGLEKVNKASTVVYGDASVRTLLDRMNVISPNEKVESLIKILEKR
ncbi:type-F conjugative transfer system pilin assembly protein TrbC (plasmid) [Enterobacter hormaechei]|uniref:type-F conjugative transfer system pilin assembly protein TrbC n=1 Tax=Enterobacter hormaechei TaxID=158836 RepID=UPI0027D24D19|nr:type-F conjugative transfer system pilin assembly protein TrbC [Enterobacter hormaechei]WLZ52000.1 type-F conjugative transfer system pilin assembly protein TrbC [Enterobacter hormaechei]